MRVLGHICLLEIWFDLLKCDSGMEDGFRKSVWLHLTFYNWFLISRLENLDCPFWYRELEELIILGLFVWFLGSFCRNWDWNGMIVFRIDVEKSFYNSWREMHPFLALLIPNSSPSNAWIVSRHRNVCKKIEEIEWCIFRVNSRKAFGGIPFGWSESLLLPIWLFSLCSHHSIRAPYL